MSNQAQEGPANEPSRMMAHVDDIIDTQIHEQWQEGNVPAEKKSEELIVEVDQFLELLGDGDKPTTQEYERLMRKIDTAIAINNDPYARELRQRLVDRFGA